MCYTELESSLGEERVLSLKKGKGESYNGNRYTVFEQGEKMSRLIIVTENEAQKTVEGLYRDLERRIQASQPGL